MLFFLSSVQWDLAFLEKAIYIAVTRITKG